ncbi:MAG: DUF4445 domain-containing protein [Deltaproteobacteria bacterium]|nr:DUF4445 domain-containing protein [Deltaproteobacteria bacterium]
MKITFLPDKKTVEATPGDRVMDIAREAGLSLRADCGGKGKCGTCRVLFESASTPPGALSEPTADEQRLLPEETGGKFYRLACTTRLYGDVGIHIPDETRVHRFSPRKPVTTYAIPIEPAVKKITFQQDLSGERRPTLSLRRRIGATLAEAAPKTPEAASLAVMAEFSRRPLKGYYDTITAAVFKESEIIQLRPDANGSLYGIALDLGTTSLAAFLCDLEKDRIVAVASLLNPQVTYGEDVISRIAHVRKDFSELDDLQDNLIEGINYLIRETVKQAGIATDELLDAVAVGNPTMQHFFLGLNPISIGEAPYLPVCFKGGEIRARDLGIEIFPLAKIHLLPMVSGFIGADTIAAMLTRSHEDFDTATLMVDVGTNGELVLAHDGRLTATSCATGPVFEGAQIRCGMRASPGAIDKVWQTDGNGPLTCHVIDDAESEAAPPKPAGICGSGVISIVAALTRAGVIKPGGAFDLDCGYPGLRTDPHSGQAEIVLVPARDSRTDRDIVFTQNDVRSVQLGKAALRAGIDILMQDAGITQLDMLFLAGTFGSYLDPRELLHIGMLPPMPLDRIKSIGNAAGDGARLALFSLKKRVVELSMRPDFQDVFIDAMSF